MQRIRLGFALLATLLLVPLVLLLDRTLSGVARERDQRHQAVASRVFDEAERALTEFLDEEQRRPPEHYFPALPDGRPSPLSQPPLRRFVIDYFQIDASGRLHSPRPDRAALLSVRLKGLIDDPQVQSQLPLERKVTGKDEQLRLIGLSAKKERSGFQRPGSTQALQKLDLLNRSELVERDDAIFSPHDDAVDQKGTREAEAQESYSSFQILERLNLAGRSRAKKSAIAPSRPSANAPSMMVPSALVGSSVTRIMARPELAPESLLEADAIKIEDLSFAKSTPDSSAPIALGQHFVDSPMASVALDDRHLILYRTTMIPGRGSYQQGLLLDVDRFAEWIEERVVVESGLSRYIEFDLVPIGELGELPYGSSARFIYDHRFGEPFEELGARLSLRSLPDSGGSANIYVMGFLLITVSTVGLWAMYRRVAIAVHFAERRSNFAAAVSHELKTPLTAIRMYAEMLRDGMVSNEAKRLEYYGTITSEAERLTRLINNVLEFSNLEKRTRKVQMTLAPVEPCLAEVVKILSPHANSHGFKLALKVEPGLDPVRFEADALQQILYNLIDNALKYAERAQRKQVDITAHPMEGGVRICVRDFGPGVSKEHHRHLFEPFYRGESEMTRRTKGTGIGLALVKGLVEEMNGEVRARNAAGGGFEVELRLRG